MIKTPKWIKDNLKRGLGQMSVYYLNLLENQTRTTRITKCFICGQKIGKWARQCPNCRNSLPL